MKSVNINVVKQNPQIIHVNFINENFGFAEKKMYPL